MKIIMMMTLFLSGCGYEARHSEMIGQVKKVYQRTPLICSDWKGADISLGVMRNGVGSMSHEDIDVYVENEQDFEMLRNAAAIGALVKITYDLKRCRFCVPCHWVTKVEILK